MKSKAKAEPEPVPATTLGPEQTAAPVNPTARGGLGLPTGTSGPATGMAQVTPNNTDTFMARSVYCATAGNLNAVGADGVEFTVAVVAGAVLPVVVTQVKTGTTATVFLLW